MFDGCSQVKYYIILRVGKTSIAKVIFQKMNPKQTMML